MNYSTDFTFYCKLNKEPGTTNISDIDKCIQNMFNLPSYYQCIDNIKFSTKNNCAFVKVLKFIEYELQKKNYYERIYHDNHDTKISVYPYIKLNKYRSPNGKLYYIF